MTDALVDRAEALMGRRRSFVAAPPTVPLGVETTPSPAPITDDDLPVLTEVITLEAEAPAPDVSPVEAVLTELGSDLADSIADRLASEIPSLFEAALANLSADLRQGIAAATETALADFIARRRQLPLPFPDEAPAVDTDSDTDPNIPASPADFVQPV